MDTDTTIFLLTEHEVHPAEDEFFGGFDYGAIQVVAVFSSLEKVAEYLLEYFEQMNHNSPFSYSLWSVTQALIDPAYNDTMLDMTDHFPALEKYNTATIETIERIQREQRSKL